MGEGGNCIILCSVRFGGLGLSVCKLSEISMEYYVLCSGSVVIAFVVPSTPHPVVSMVERSVGQNGTANEPVRTKFRTHTSAHSATVCDHHSIGNGQSLAAGERRPEQNDTSKLAVWSDPFFFCFCFASCSPY